MTYREHCQIHYEYDGDWRKKKNAAVEAVLNVLIKHGLKAAEACLVLNDAKEAVFNHARLDESVITCWRDWSGAGQEKDPSQVGKVPKR